MSFEAGLPWKKRAMVTHTNTYNCSHCFIVPLYKGLKGDKKRLLYSTRAVLFADKTVYSTKLDADHKKRAILSGVVVLYNHIHNTPQTRNTRQL